MDIEATISQLKFSIFSVSVLGSAGLAGSGRRKRVKKDGQTRRGVAASQGKKKGVHSGGEEGKTKGVLLRGIVSALLRRAQVCPSFVHAERRRTAAKCLSASLLAREYAKFTATKTY